MGDSRISVGRSRLTEWAVNGLLVLGAIVSTYLVVTQ